jgi:hypothetical protein
MGKNEASKSALQHNVYRNHASGPITASNALVLGLFGRNKKSQVYLAKVMSQPALRAKTSHAQRADDRYIVQR